VIEVADPDALPLLTVLVRRKGVAVAAYADEYQAWAHAAPCEDATVTWDRMTGLPPAPKHWETQRYLRQLAADAVDDLVAWWLGGCQRDEVHPPPPPALRGL
jgi:hypothetical protein